MIWRCRENFSLRLLAVASQSVFCLRVPCFVCSHSTSPPTLKVIQLSQLLTGHKQ